MDDDLCERCGKEPRYGPNKYCKQCKKDVLQELKDSGYLRYAYWGHPGEGRTADQRENIRETKYGRDG